MTSEKFAIKLNSISDCKWPDFSYSSVVGLSNFTIPANALTLRAFIFQMEVMLIINVFVNISIFIYFYMSIYTHLPLLHSFSTSVDQRLYICVCVYRCVYVFIYVNVCLCTFCVNRRRYRQISW